ncbi:MAG: hypothetical protein ACRC1U_07970, partial [Vibrionaceae bacterium]
MAAPTAMAVAKALGSFASSLAQNEAERKANKARRNLSFNHLNKVTRPEFDFRFRQREEGNARLRDLDTSYFRDDDSLIRQQRDAALDNRRQIFDVDFGANRDTFDRSLAAAFTGLDASRQAREANFRLRQDAMGQQRQFQDQ